MKNKNNKLNIEELYRVFSEIGFYELYKNMSEQYMIVMKYRDELSHLIRDRLVEAGVQSAFLEYDFNKVCKDIMKESNEILSCPKGQGI